MPFISPFSTIYPVSSDTDSTLPPVRYVMTGVPQAKDSRFVVGNVSSQVGLIKTEAKVYKVAN